MLSNLKWDSQNVLELDYKYYIWLKKSISYYNYYTWNIEIYKFGARYFIGTIITMPEEKFEKEIKRVLMKTANTNDPYNLIVKIVDWPNPLEVDIGLIVSSMGEVGYGL